MDLYEHEGKALFRNYGIPVPNGILVTRKNWKKEIKKIKQINKIKSDKFVLKAQVLHGKRRKLGLILFTSKDKVLKRIKNLFQKNKTVTEILVEEKLVVAKEYYLSIIVNQSKACYSLLFSESGGIDIEDVSKNKIKKIDFFIFDKKIKKQVQKITKKKRITAIVQKLFKFFKEKDATLVEINPLILTKSKQFVAADAKITIDDNALYRQKELQSLQFRNKTLLEKEAAEYGLHYVELDGNIAVIGNGAGLVMATLDLLQQHTLKPANFLDAPGGTTKKAMLHSLQIALKKSGIKVLFINMFGGMTETDAVAQAIIEFNQKYHPKIPFIIRIYGTHWQEAHALLKKAGIHVYRNINDAIEELKRVVK